MTGRKLLKGLLGLIVVIMLVGVVNSWWHEYKSAESVAKPETTGTVTATTTASLPIRAVDVLTDGLNLREKPDATGATIRGLKRGEKYMLVGQVGPATKPTWLQVKDDKGTLGWVANNPQYVRIQK